MVIHLANFGQTSHDLVNPWNTEYPDDQVEFSEN